MPNCPYLLPLAPAHWRGLLHGCNQAPWMPHTPLRASACHVLGSGNHCRDIGRRHRDGAQGQERGSEQPRADQKERKAQKSRAARRARKAAEGQAERERQEREEQERAARLRPLVDRIVAALEPRDLASPLRVFGASFSEHRTLLRLLGEVAR